ncbi:hypothetical protein FisN_19Hu274 [Fistulifera solaris]|uniref:Uncharacterized protein n=1 Tax=Fistulifera solaris TaxID=1519565 RepID=A0A1Z5K0Z0_FISSO|nr:hypothetical protein FisN_19Hu274 [Fistulifera solaris]|eukprot:GAX19688.1 hypothetical protein FisN_19Hu274 [Fistulifera solaris]
MFQRSYFLATLIGIAAFTLLQCGVTALQMNELSRSSPPTFSDRRHFLVVTTTTAAAATTTLPVQAFEGGIGGLGKTKPETGVEFLSPPFQSVTGAVSAEVVIQSSPYLLEFHSPSLPLLPTSAGLEVRQLPDPESAYVQIIPGAKVPITKQDVSKLLETSILSSTGKFGAYLTPTDVKVTRVDENLWKVRFTAYTPGLRESDRQLLLRIERVDRACIVLVAGTTLQRYAKQEPKLRAIVDSFRVVPAPSTRLKS